MKTHQSSIGDRFIIRSRGYYHDKHPIVFTVTRVNADSISFVNPDDTVLYTLTDVNMVFYGDKVKVVERAKKPLIAKLRAVIDSKESESIEVSLERREYGKRYYIVTTTRLNNPHRYYVTVADFGQSKCCCIAFHRYNRCRHLSAALAKDTAMFGTAERMAA